MEKQRPLRRLLLNSLVVFCFVLYIEAADIYVSPTSGYPTLLAALNAASENDTIFIHPSVVTEEVRTLFFCAKFTFLHRAETFVVLGISPLNPLFVD